MAGEGVRFTNAFVPAPTCTPCRSSVLSGRYFWQTGLGAILQGALLIALGRQPFCYWWGPTNTHRKWKRGSGAALWDLNPDDLAGDVPLDVLEEHGELDTTLVVVSGDHGIPGFPRAKCNLYDIGCEVALIARWPGMIPPGRAVDDMVNLMDLAPSPRGHARRRAGSAAGSSGCRT